MPPWMKRWLAWVGDNLFRHGRLRLLRAAVGYEQAGTAHWTVPIPWTANTGLIDVWLQLAPYARRKSDFGLRLPHTTVAADSFGPETDEPFRIRFRFPVPPHSIDAELVWRNQPVGTVTVPVLTRDTFLNGLTLVNPTVAAQFGDRITAVSAFVPTRCNVMLATAVLRSPVPLAPISELPVRALFVEEQTRRTHTVTVSLNAAQLSATETLVMAVCPETPQHPGAWWVTWMVEERLLTTHRVWAIPAEQLERQVRLVETRLAVANLGETICIIKTLPPTGPERVGPAFVLIGDEPGTAGLCRFELRAIMTSDSGPDLTRQTEAVITDTPTIVVPALFDTSELTCVNGFELRLNGRLIGLASLRLIPAAAINAEGGFTPPTDFAWSATAEDELADRLKRLSR